jgi:hypothetical protein
MTPRDPGPEQKRASVVEHDGIVVLLVSLLVTIAIPLVVALLVATLVAPGCAADGAQRQLCYARAEAAAWVDVEHSCFKLGLMWDQCPARERILGELAQEHRSCP